MVTLVNRAKMATAATGTGSPITLGSAVDGYQTFGAAGVTDGQIVRYVIEDGSNWEIGTGTYTASGTTLSRTPSESSNAGSAINLSGQATVFITATAADVLQVNTQTGSTSSTSQTAIAAYATASYDAAKVVVVADNGTDRTVSELLVTWKSTTAYATEYAIVNTGTTTLATYAVDVSGGDFRILATAASATSTSYTVKAIVL